MQQSKHKLPHILRLLGFRFRTRINHIFLPLSLVLLAANLLCSTFIVDEKVNSHSKVISERLNQITIDIQPIVEQWLNTTDDTLHIQQLWLGSPFAYSDQGVSLLLFSDSVMVYWSNYTWQKLELKSTGTIRQIDQQQSITQHYNKGNHHAMVIINLHDNNTGRYNESIFPEQRITLLPLSDSVYAQTIQAETISAANNQFYLEAKLIKSSPWWGEMCGWFAILFLCLYIKNVIIRRTKKHNIFTNSGILLLLYTLIRIGLYYLGIPNSNGEVFSKIFGQHNLIISSLGDLILSYSMLFIYLCYLYQIRIKLKWRYNKLSFFPRVLILFFLCGLIAFMISIFHYALIMAIHEPKINIQIYDIFELTYNSALFYILAVLFVSSRLLIAKILIILASTRYLWLRICFTSGLIWLLLLPIEDQIQNTGYILIIFFTISAATSYIRTNYNNYGSFAISLIVFSAYISAFTMMENTKAQDSNQVLYARYLATSQQDRHIIDLDEPSINDLDLGLRFQDFTYAHIKNKEVIFKHDNSIDYQGLNTGLTSGRDTTLYRDDYSHFTYNYFDQDDEHCIIVVSRRDITFLNIISLYAYIYIILFILCGLLLKMVGYTFNNQRLGTRMTIKIQSVIIIIVIGTMATVTMVVVSHMLHNFRSDRRQFIHNNSQYLQLSLGQFLDNNTFDKLSVNQWIKNEAHDTEYSTNIFAVDGSLIASSDKETTTTRMNSAAYRYLHYMRNPFFITNLDLSQHSSAYSPIAYQGELLGYLNIQDPISSASNSRLQNELLTDIINLFFIIFCIAIILSDMLYLLLIKPFNQLRKAMSNISKMQKIDAVGSSRKISDEVGLLVEQYNLMIDNLAESYHQLSRSERDGAWREMAQQVAHEIKNPLTPMRLKIQMLQSAMKQESCEDLRPKVESTMSILLEQIELLTKITSDFSDFAKIDKSNPKRINIVPIIYHVAKLYCDFENIGIRLRLNINNQMEEHIICSEMNCTISEPTDINECSDPIWVNADSYHLTRAFVNICQNAIQAMSAQEDSWLEIELLISSNSVLISFRDNGHGIPEDICEKILTPRFTTKSNGSGLGLPMSQKIVEAISGHLRFESTFGIGTTFIVELPLCEDSEVL